MSLMMSVPKVSVILPVYNGQKYLPAAIDSILWQDFRNFELLVIDDGSGDDSRDIVRSYDDKRIKLIINERNLGLAIALNRGLAMARGD
jgi:glycosyltransferase involved in cell wall biosynthesis